MLGEIQARLTAMEQNQLEAREDHRSMATDLKGVCSDVAGVKSDIAALKTDVGGVKKDIAEMKPTVKLVNEARLKAAGVITFISIASGVLGGFLEKKFF